MWAGPRIVTWTSWRRVRSRVTREVTMNSLQDRPACPLCGKNMVLRTRNRDQHVFWGCVQYPDCRGTRPEYVPDPDPNNGLEID
jgi:ssDNA-binding Zn-finger/Zn-ribbon topoisomerase 1